MPRFEVVRPCAEGCCPCVEGDGACACVEPNVDVDVDELSREELARFRAFGSEEQQAEIVDWLSDECPPEEAIAGQPDLFPELGAA